jgi:hypothetical protein
MRLPEEAQRTFRPGSWQSLLRLGAIPGTVAEQDENEGPMANWGRPM